MSAQAVGMVSVTAQKGQLTLWQPMAGLTQLGGHLLRACYGPDGAHNGPVDSRPIRATAEPGKSHC